MPLQRLARQHLVAHEVPALVVAALAELQRRAVALAPAATAAARPPACGTSSARTCRRAPRRATARPSAGRRWAGSAASAPAAWPAQRRGDHVEVLVVALDPVERRDRVKYSPSLLATSPTDTQSGTSGCRAMMRADGVERRRGCRRARRSAWADRDCEGRCRTVRIVRS